MVIFMKQPLSLFRNFLPVFLTLCILFTGCAQQENSSEISVLSDEPDVSEALSSPDSQASDIPTLASQVPPSNTDSSSSPPENPSQTESDPAAQADAFFDDAVFIGDSVSLKLKYYCMQQRKTGQSTLGQAQFLVSGSMGSANALRPVSPESIHPSYQGKKMALEDSVAQMKANKVFLMLGMNDIGLYGIDASMQNLDTLIQRILSKSPSASIFLQSVTPMLKGSERETLNNAVIQEYNAQLQAYCQEKEFTYLDIASKMQDGDGFLIPAYCSDPEAMGIHFTDLACSIWVDTLESIAS